MIIRKTEADRRARQRRRVRAGTSEGLGTSAPTSSRITVSATVDQALHNGRGKLREEDVSG